MATKSTGSKIGSLAGKTLGNANASKTQKSLAGSALAQVGTAKITSKAMETKASTALKSDKSSSTARSLAATAVSQAKKSLEKFASALIFAVQLPDDRKDYH